MDEAIVGNHPHPLGSPLSAPNKAQAASSWVEVHLDPYVRYQSLQDFPKVHYCVAFTTPLEGVETKFFEPLPVI